MADAHLDDGGWEWHYDDTNDMSKAILTRVVWVDGSTEVNIPEHLSGAIDILTIATNCFKDAQGAKITKVLSMPSTITSIGTSAFEYCILMTDCVIGNGIITIGDRAFYHCEALASVTIPNSVTSIGYIAFYRCIVLTVITVDPTNTNYASIDGVLYNKAVTTLIQCPGGWAGAFIIPSTVTSIGTYAFARLASLTSVTIPNSVITIGEAAFGLCTSLTSVTIPNSVITIEKAAFESCTSLTSLTIPNSVITMGEWGFASCTALVSVTIGNGVTSIGFEAFGSCTSLTSVTIGSGVTTIVGETFFGCISLISITFLGLVAPTSVGANWIWNTNVGILGHAYAASNFPIPGNAFYGLTMGDVIGYVRYTPSAKGNDAVLFETPKAGARF